MSMITEQVKRLRDAANRFDADGAEPSDGELMREAADTIEILSAKVQAANMERSTAYYNGGWFPVSERLPEDGTWNLFTDGRSMSVERYKADALDHFYPSGRWFSLDETVAWMPLPKPYKEREDKE